MKSFEDRQKGFEAVFQRDQELAFRITARRNRLFGLWAAGRLGLAAGEEGEAHANDVVGGGVGTPGDSDVIAKVRTDLAEKGITASEGELRAELERAATEARKQLAER